MAQREQYMKRKSLNKFTSTFTLAQLGLDWFFVAISTCRDLPTADANEKIASLTKKFGGNSRKEIQAMAVVVSSSGSKSGSHFSVLIG
ncbi:hypothetical protein KY290_029968 [Solanum tuberosum]|uniref:Uncharacterized protein n=1 Tax=Solanum tuberosum TaxID=4113 RepID=A0ABQ7UM78_SOLTU|nr:hypothetical protein KY290_029968 [Solanum tuberosum]